MRLELTGRHVDITPALRRMVETKLSKIERLLNDRAVSAHAVLTREKHRHRADITLHARGEKFLHGVADAAAWEPSIGAAIEKLTQQALKVKGKWEARKTSARRRPAAVAAAEAVAGPELVRAARARTTMPPILRATRQALASMSVADAARALAVDGDGVVLFRDVETASVSVLYRRRNGDLTLVQTEA
jgi:putative sigma-54 modulation protein